MAIQSVKTKAAPSTTAPTTSPLPVRAASKAIAASGAASGDDTKKTRAPKGPSLTWDSARNLALFRAIKGGITSKSALAQHLASDPAFDDVDPGAFTALKIGTQIKKLRSANESKPGVLAVLDTVQRERRGGGGSLDIDLDALDAMDAS